MFWDQKLFWVRSGSRRSRTSGKFQCLEIWIFQFSARFSTLRSILRLKNDHGSSRYSPQLSFAKKIGGLVKKLPSYGDFWVATYIFLTICHSAMSAIWLKFHLYSSTLILQLRMSDSVRFSRDVLIFKNIIPSFFHQVLAEKNLRFFPSL